MSAVGSISSAAMNLAIRVSEDNLRTMGSSRGAFKKVPHPGSIPRIGLGRALGVGVWKTPQEIPQCS